MHVHTGLGVSHADASALRAGFKAWIHAVDGQVGSLLEPGRLAAIEDMPTGQDVRIAINCSECDDHGFRRVEALDEQLRATP